MMTKIILALIVIVSISHAADDRVKIDARVLAQLPEKRHAALVLYAIGEDDGSPGISVKTAKYIDALKSWLVDLRKAYYWNSHFPNDDIDHAIETRAEYLADLHYPASPSTGCSYYGSLIQSYTVKMYEEEIVTVAYAITERAKDRDVDVQYGPVRAFDEWLKAWVKAGEVENEPNQAVQRNAYDHVRPFIPCPPVRRG